jgi:hypothetical protein
MAFLQLQFTLRTSPNVKTVHLLDSWDNYTGQLPLSSDSSISGDWKGTFWFQGTTLMQGQRYWYYVRSTVNKIHPFNFASMSRMTQPRTRQESLLLVGPLTSLMFL